MSKLINKYPDWVEQYRGKGKTIRKTKYGYGLYKCSSVYVKDSPYPKSVQEFLGMIYEDKGFVPKDKKVDHEYTYIEYGLSKFIMTNFKRDLKRSSYDGNDNIIYLGIISFIFSGISKELLDKSFLTYKNEDIKDYLDKANINRINNIYKRIDELFKEKIKDDADRLNLINYLKLMVIDTSNNIKPQVLNEVKDITDRYGLKLWQ